VYNEADETTNRQRTYRTQPRTAEREQVSRGVCPQRARTQQSYDAGYSAYHALVCSGAGFVEVWECTRGERPPRYVLNVCGTRYLMGVGCKIGIAALLDDMNSRVA
jgi:hypothetical protein